MITRTIKNTKVKFLNINVAERTFEEKEVTVDYGMTEKQIEKHLKTLGFNPVDIKTENIPAARYGLSEKDFYLFGDIIEKKSDINGRSVTKELDIKRTTAVFAVKNVNRWEIKEGTVYMINGNFDSRDYTSKSVKLLEIMNEWTEEYNGLVGMDEEKFVTIGHVIK